MDIRTFIRHIAQRYGYDIVRYSLQSAESTRLTKLFVDHRVTLVFDIGANIGQYACALRDRGYRGKIISFEPITTAFVELTANASKDSLWTCIRSAVGSSEGTATIHIAGNSQSSSLLQMLPDHLDASPGSRYLGTEETPLTTLDRLLSQHATPGDVVFVKVDTQGFEGQVLEGAPRALETIAGLELEMSFSPLYEGEKTFAELLTFVESRGFFLTSIEPVLFHPRTGKVLQVNGTFFRPAVGSRQIT